MILVELTRDEWGRSVRDGRLTALPRSPFALGILWLRVDGSEERMVRSSCWKLSLAVCQELDYYLIDLNLSGLLVPRLSQACAIHVIVTPLSVE